MSQTPMPRSMVMFFEAKSMKKSEFTKNQYHYWLKRFMVWRNIQDPDQLLIGADIENQRHIENYILFLKNKGHTLAMINAAIYPIFLFYFMNDVILNKTKIINLLPIQTIKTGGGAYDTNRVKIILETLGRRQALKVLRNKAIIHFIAASGCRVGAIPDLKFADLTKIKNTYQVKIYAGTKSEYLSFLTPEAANALDKYLVKRELEENIMPESSLFDIKYGALRAMITRLVKKAGVVKKIDKRFDIPSAHGFRKRWNTELKAEKDLNPILIEKIFGHNVIALDENYNKPTPERLFLEYKKGIKALTIQRHANKI